MKILIVDDLLTNRRILKKMLPSSHEFFLVDNGLDAINVVLKEQPDLIFMDVIMPGINGIETTQAIRDKYTEKWIPIIILSALTDEDSIVAGLNAGADDYLTKPLNRVILLAKLARVQHSIAMQYNLLKANKQLNEYQQENEIEHSFTQDIFDHLIQHKELDDDAQVDCWILPSKRFSGDLLSFKRISAERIYFIIADATGHGLAASVPTIIVNQVFQAMTEKQFLVSSIAKEINHRLRVDIPIGRFVALAIGMIDSHNKTIEIWNGGLPELFVINNNCEVVHAFKSQHVFSGVLGDNDFDQRTDVWHWTEVCELFAYTDGVTDVLDNNGKLFGEQRLLGELLKSKPTQRIKHIKNKVQGFMDQQQEQDDVSCLSIRCQ
ncbi:MAG: fused response regulator/phosphatase [Methylococcales bacterium]